LAFENPPDIYFESKVVGSKRSPAMNPWRQNPKPFFNSKSLLSYTLSESVYAGRNLEVSGWVGYHAAREAQSRCIGIAE